MCPKQEKGRKENPGVVRVMLVDVNGDLFFLQKRA